MKNMLTLVLTLIACTLAARSQVTLRGIIIDNKKVPLEEVNVLLLNSRDSSLVKGVVTTKEGQYELPGVGIGTYLIQASKIGYGAVYSPIITIGETGSTKELPILMMVHEPKSMKEIVVNSRKPFIEQKLDRLIVNLENSIISAGNSGLEVLEKLPGVSVQPNGSISLNGKGGVQIFIDGRPTNLSAQDLASFLSGLTASQIEKIELISNPSSRYEAAGSGGIINIRMKKDQKTGLNGTATVGYAQGKYGKDNGGLNLNYRAKKYNIYGNYTLSHRKSLTDMTSSRKFREGTTVLSEFIQDGRALDRNTAYNLRTGIDLFLSSRTTVGFLASGVHNRFGQLSDNRTEMTNEQGVVDSILFTQSDNSSRWKVYTANSNFKHLLDSTGKELSLDLDYSSYQRSNDQFFRNVSTDAVGTIKRSPDTLTGVLPALLEIASFKADYIHPIRQGFRMEAGIKASQIKNDNDLLFYNLMGNGPKVNRTLSNHFIYEERIHAVYLNFAQEAKSWNYQLGLRGEQTIARGNQLTTAQKFKRNYFQLFPTAFVNFALAPKHQIGFSYSRRIGRPAYNIVNPFKVFRDPYTYSEGNPFIKPSISNRLQLNYVFNNKIIVGLSYGNTGNSMTFVVKQDDATKTTIETYDNLARLQDGGLTVSSTIRIASWWTGNIFAGAFYNHFKGIYSNQVVNNSGVILNASLNQSITLPRSYTLEFSGFYLSEQPQGIITIAPQANVNIGIQKQFLQKRGTVRLSFADIFRTQQWNRETRFANIEALFNSRWDSRQVRLNLSWKFGKQTVPGERKRKTSSEEEKNRVQMDQGK